MSAPGRADKPIRVLVVDDVREDRDVCRRFLRKSPVNRFFLEEAETVSDGVSACLSHPPDCVLLDYRLPDGDGFDFLEKITDATGVVALPVVMMTGVGNEEIAVRALKQGAMDYIVKGRIRDESFCHTLQTAMEKASLLATIRRQETEKDEIIIQLQNALEEVKTLKGIVPICAVCKNIRNDEGFWQKVETFIQEHSEAEFSHGICPDCIRKYYPEYSDKILWHLKDPEE